MYRLLELCREQLINGLWFDIFGTGKVGKSQETLHTSECGRVRRFCCMRNVSNDLEHQARILLHLACRVVKHRYDCIEHGPLRCHRTTLQRDGDTPESHVVDEHILFIRKVVEEGCWRHLRQLAALAY